MTAEQHETLQKLCTQSLHELFYSINPRKRADMMPIYKNVENATKGGLAAMFLLGVVWRFVKDAGYENLTFGPEVEALLAACEPKFEVVNGMPEWISEKR